jgi:hypothetical protein
MLTKYTRTALGLSLGCSIALFAVACGSSEGDEEGLSGSGNQGNGTGGTSNVSLGGSGGGTLGGGNRDGGSVPLTEEDVEAIADAACAGWTTEGENLPAVLQLVVDVSRSMEDRAPGSEDSKWDVTRDALTDAIAGLPDSVSVGVLYYPNQGIDSSEEPRSVNACVSVGDMVPIEVLGSDGHREAVLQSLQDADTGSLTPTHDAYRYALAEGLIPYETPLRKFMLLITDGAPTMAEQCVGDTRNVRNAPTEPIIDEIAGAFEAGIRTFLIGSPGSEESSVGDNMDMRPWLSQAAVEGGTALDGCDVTGDEFCHLDMTQETDFAQALADGLEGIVGQVVDSCTFTIPASPDGETIDPNLTNMVINWTDGDASLILPDDGGDCGEGWQFSGTDQVTLCGETCEAVKADAGARVQLTFGCRSEDIIPVR